MDRYLADPGRWSTEVEHLLGNEPDMYRRLKSFRHGSSRVGTIRTSVIATEPVLQELDRRGADWEQWSERDEQMTWLSKVAQQQCDYSSWDAEKVLGRLEEDGRPRLLVLIVVTVLLLAEIIF